MTSETTTQELGYGDAVRSQIEHEDVLLVNRLSWLIASESFLFTAYAIILNGPVVTRSAQFAAHRELLVNIVPLLAISTDTLIYLGICGAVRVMANLRRELARHHAAIGNLRPPIQGTRLTLFLGHCAPLGLPPIFAAAWTILLLMR
jgi:hypothetical protein